jgi:hypothetical protein
MIKQKKAKDKTRVFFLPIEKVKETCMHCLFYIRGIIYE